MRQHCCWQQKIVLSEFFSECCRTLLSCCVYTMPSDAVDGDIVYDKIYWQDIGISTIEAAAFGKQNKSKKWVRTVPNF